MTLNDVMVKLRPRYDAFSIFQDGLDFQIFVNFNNRNAQEGVTVPNFVEIGYMYKQSKLHWICHSNVILQHHNENSAKNRLNLLHIIILATSVGQTSCTISHWLKLFNRPAPPAIIIIIIIITRLMTHVKVIHRVKNRKCGKNRNIPIFSYTQRIRYVALRTANDPETLCTLTDRRRASNFQDFFCNVVSTPTKRWLATALTNIPIFSHTQRIRLH